FKYSVPVGPLATVEAASKVTVPAASWACTNLTESACGDEEVLNEEFPDAYAMKTSEPCTAQVGSMNTASAAGSVVVFCQVAPESALRCSSMASCAARAMPEVVTT